MAVSVTLLSCFVFVVACFLGFRCAVQKAETMDGDVVNVKRIKYVNVSFILKTSTKALLL